MTENWLEKERFAVWGLGKSGVAAANLLARRGKQVLASDIRSADALEEQLGRLDDAVDWRAGENAIGDAEVVVVSPGLRPGLEVISKARGQGVPVISEVDLAFDASSAIWVAITGTDGKTTTTSLAGAMVEASGRECVVAGNIGTALCDVVESVSVDGVIVAEVSANQLWSCHHLAVRTAAITNIAEDHLDYFDDFDDYGPAKYRLVELQGGRGTAVLPGFDNKISDDLAGHLPEQVISFDAGQTPSGEYAVYFDEQGRGRWRWGGEEGTWFEDFRRHASLLGVHNQLNAACAAAVAHSVGASWEDCARALREFSALPHRMEPVGEVEGVFYINDSKATNAHASLAGLIGVEAPLVVIAGGRDKGLDLEAWAQTVAERAELVILIGEIRSRMARLLEAHGGTVDKAASVEEAVRLAHKRSKPGSNVVLSPACSSYDMFSSYKARGKCFEKAVRGLQER